MAIYSKTMSDEEILSLIPMEIKRILIVACGGCVNESLAFDYNIPILCDQKPYASHFEAERISRMLVQNGYSTGIKSVEGDFPVLCIYSSESLTSVLDDVTLFDMVLTVSCLSGALGVRLITSKPVKSITRQVGYLSYTYHDVGGKREIIKEFSCGQLFAELRRV